MKKLSFHYAHAENILCFGPEGVNFYFDDYGQVVQVRGINLDNPGTSDVPASNGAGKSSIQEILSIGLFGVTVKNPTKAKRNFLRTNADKGQVEVEWDDCRVMRIFKRSSAGSVSSKIRIWQSKDHIWDEDSEITFGTPKEVEDWINRKIGLLHHPFCNVVIFDDSNFYSFLEFDTPTKREFVENLLGLEAYREYNENAKKLLKANKESIEKLGQEYSLLRANVDSCERRIQNLQTQTKTWTDGKMSAIMSISAKIKVKQTELSTTNVGNELEKWEKAQQRIAELNQLIEDQQDKIGKYQKVSSEVRDRCEAAKHHRDSVNGVIQEHSLALKTAQSELDKQLKLIEKLDKLEDGTTCPVCHGVINKASYGKVLQHSHNIAQEQRDCIHSENAAIKLHKEQYDVKNGSVAVLQQKLGEADQKIMEFQNKIHQYQKEVTTLSSVSKPDGDSKQQVLEAEISELKNQALILKKELENSPYSEILANAEQEKKESEEKADNKAIEIKKEEKETPYYQFWVEAFGDRGIRRYIVDGIIPALNSRIAYWLTYLIDGKIELSFDNEFNETISRNGTPVIYHLVSNGEKRRINLAVSQAFAYVMMLNSGCCPSLVFLDEITGGGIDRAGVIGIYNMIVELAKERQVFITTHNETLMSMLHGCETLTLKKENDVTVLCS